MNRFAAFALSLISLITFRATTISADEPISVGVSLPLTGSGSTYGTDFKNIFIFANEKLGQNRFKLIFEDDRCDPKEAVNVAHKLINSERVKHVIGLPCSGTILASAPVYEKAKVLTISAFAGSPKVSAAGDYIFRMRPSDIAAAELLGQHVAKNFSRVGVIAEQTDYAQGLAAAFEESAGAEKFSIVREDFLSGTSDLKPLMLRLQTKKAEALVLFTQTELSLSIAVKQIHELKLKLPILSSLFPGNASFLQLAGPTAEGIIFSTLPGAYESSNIKTRELFEEFVKRFGPLKSFDAGFECGYNAFAALVAVSRTDEDARKYLYTHAIDGMSAPFSFDKNGDSLGMNFVMRKIKGGKVSPL